MLMVVARLKDGVSLTEAQAEMSIIAANQAAAFPATNTGRGVRLFPLRNEFAGSAGAIYYILFAASSGVLVVACLNVAHLLLLRGARSQRELAVRASLGASRLRLMRQLLMESTLLALAGAAAGLVLSRWTFDFFSAFIPPGMAFFAELRVDASAIMITIALAVITAAIAGLSPAMRLSRLQLAAAMQEGGRSGTSAQGRRLRNVIVVCEISIAVVLLVCSTLFISTMMRIYAEDPGFDVANLLFAELRIRRTDYMDTVLERVRSVPGIVSAGLSTSPPMAGFGGRPTFIIEDFPHHDAIDQPRGLYRTIGVGYLETLKVPLLRGRLFNDQDTKNSQRVAIINESMRKRFWPDADPIGRRLKRDISNPNNPWFTIVGVVGDVRQRALDIAPEPEVMVAYRQYEGAGIYNARSIVLRSAGDSTVLMDRIRGEIEAVDRSTIVSVETMEGAAAQGVSSRVPRTILITAFAALTLILSVLSVYSLVSFSVADRTQEIGVRLALGARPDSVIGMIAKEGFRLAVVGCAIGLVISGALTRSLRTFLYGVTPTQPEIFAGAAILILAIAVAASYFPARRVRKIDPVAALRVD
jgi:putative ABC transport system permease protein